MWGAVSGHGFLWLSTISFTLYFSVLTFCNASWSPFCQRLSTLSRIFADLSLAFYMTCEYPYSPIPLYTSEKNSLPLSNTKYISIVFVSVLFKTSSLFTCSALVFSTFFSRIAFLLHGVTYSSVRRLSGIYCHIERLILCLNIPAF